MTEELLAGLRQGTYVLILRLSRDRRIQVGKLGSFEFRSGFYAYVGSAFGPGGLAGRLKHHLMHTVRPHWHIDYLRKVAELEQVWLSESEAQREHDWAVFAQKLPEATLSVRGFGLSDCRCETHLFYLHKEPSMRLFQDHIQNQFPGDTRVRSLEIRLPR
jgi:Uri superfamily endonuclease